MDTLTDINDMEPSYADLPMEIIAAIFRYLPFADRQTAGLVCRRWLEATQCAEFQSNVCLKFVKLCLSDKLAPASLFLRSGRCFHQLYVEECTLGTIDQFLPRLTNTIRSISLNNVEMNDKQFCNLLEHMKQLRSLTITRCSLLFMAGQFLDSPADRLRISAALSKVQLLSLRYNQYLSDAILLRLTSMMQSLETLDMSGCHIAYHSAIQRRFYPDGQLQPSESILTFKFILQIVAAHHASLRDLDFSDTLIGSTAIDSLCKLEGELRLERLRLRVCRQLNPTAIRTFLPTQKSLRLLDLSGTECVTDECVECLVQSAPLLESLSLKGCWRINNKGAKQLAKLPYLRSLDLSYCNNIGSDGVIEGIAYAPNTVLRELRLSHMNLCVPCIKLCARNLSELRVLDIGKCISAVTDESVRFVIENLRWLRELIVEDCFKITDAALTGIHVDSELPTNKTNSAESFHPLPRASLAESPSADRAECRPMKISLRSKAEEDIVRDANRKKAMLAIYELNQSDPFEEDIAGVSIQRLKSLQVLNLKGCNKISDVSLKYGLKFSGLRRLLLSNCQQVSLVGMEALVQNCPSIEELDLSECCNINDKTIEVVCSKLRRLRDLDISGCLQLTDHCLDSIVANCKVLQTLSVYRCRRMYTDIEERLTSLTSLRTLNMEHNTLDNADVLRLRKRLDY